MSRAGALLVLVVALLPAVAQAHALRPPAAGDWEGRGPHGLALSFQLTRTQKGIRADSLTVMRPYACPATVRRANAQSVPTTGYAGPGAAPPFLQVPLLARPGTIDISGLLPGSPFPLEIEGRLHGRTRATVTTLRPSFSGNACWPRMLRFELRRSHRVAVADGHWAGTQTDPSGATVTVQVDVTGHGRLVSSFGFGLYCPGQDPASGQPAFGLGPDVNGRFIAATGTFSGAYNATSSLVWSGRFAAGVLTGSISHIGQQCGADPGDISAGFSATHVSGR